MALPIPYLVEQTVKKQTTIADGETGTISIPIPSGQQGALKGYGYTWYDGCTFQLAAGQIQFPLRADQEGSASIPRLFEQAITIKGGESASLTIVNSSGASRTFDIVFYFYVTQLFPNTTTYQSDGGELVIATGGGGGVAGSVAIFDSTFVTSANVTAKGLSVDVSASTSVATGTATAAAAGAAMAASTACKKVTLTASPLATVSAEGWAFYVGGSGGQDFPISAGSSITLTVDNLADVYVKRAGAANVTVMYIYEA